MTGLVVVLVICLLSWFVSLSPRGDGHFQVLKRVNNNVYKLDLPEQSRVHDTFNVIDLIHFACSTDDETKTFDLRRNPLQEGGSDGRAQLKTNH